MKNQTREVVEEIMAYKWLESEKLGCDIGTHQAAEEWIGNHYDDWFSHNKKKFCKRK